MLSSIDCLLRSLLFDLIPIPTSLFYFAAVAARQTCTTPCSCCFAMPPMVRSKGRSASPFRQTIVLNSWESITENRTVAPTRSPPPTGDEESAQAASSEREQVCAMCVGSAFHLDLPSLPHRCAGDATEGTLLWGHLIHYLRRMMPVCLGQRPDPNSASLMQLDGGPAETAAAAAAAANATPSTRLYPEVQSQTRTLSDSHSKGSPQSALVGSRRSMLAELKKSVKGAEAKALGGNQEPPPGATASLNARVRSAPPQSAAGWAENYASAPTNVEKQVASSPLPQPPEPPLTSPYSRGGSLPCWQWAHSRDAASEKWDSQFVDGEEAGPSSRLSQKRNSRQAPTEGADASLPGEEIATHV